MAISAKTFLIELYEEYLEEASFLYEQRLSLLVNPEISWKKIGEFEERSRESRAHAFARHRKILCLPAGRLS